MPKGKSILHTLFRQLWNPRVTRGNSVKDSMSSSHSIRISSDSFPGHSRRAWRTSSLVLPLCTHVDLHSHPYRFEVFFMASRFKWWGTGAKKRAFGEMVCWDTFQFDYHAEPRNGQDNSQIFGAINYQLMLSLYSCFKLNIPHQLYSILPKKEVWSGECPVHHILLL